MIERIDGDTSGSAVHCIACNARRGGVCGVLDQDQLSSLARTALKKRIETGAELIGEAQAVEVYSHILSGVVKLTKSLPDGREQIVGLQFAPDFVGRPFQRESATTARAATNVVLCSFPKRTIEALIRRSPQVEHVLLDQTLRQLDEAREWMLTLGRKNAIEKVASYLLLISRTVYPATQKSPPKIVFDLPMSRLEIADFLGLTIETVSRQLTKLRIDGIIEISQNRHVVVANPARLRFLSGC